MIELRVIKWMLQECSGMAVACLARSLRKMSRRPEEVLQELIARVAAVRGVETPAKI